MASCRERSSCLKTTFQVVGMTRYVSGFLGLGWYFQKDTLETPTIKKMSQWDVAGTHVMVIIISFSSHSLSSIPSSYFSRLHTLTVK